MSSHVRIEEDGDIAGPRTKVIYVASDGAETDISSVTTAVRYSGKVGDANTATLELIKVRATAKVPLVEVVVRDFKRKRLWKLWRHIDVTTLGSKTRRYISA